MTGYDTNLTTLCETSLNSGKDSEGLFRSANFKENKCFVSVVKRPSYFTLDFSDSKSLSQVFDILQESKPVDFTVLLENYEDDVYVADSDSWSPTVSQDLKRVCFSYQGLDVNWFPFYTSTDRFFADVSIKSEDSEYLADALEIYNCIYSGSSSEKVFEDINSYLGNQY